jgi:hypothetical protein
MRVTGSASPAASKIWVMPIFLPISPFIRFSCGCP